MSEADITIDFELLLTLREAEPVERCLYLMTLEMEMFEGRSFNDIGDTEWLQFAVWHEIADNLTAC